MAKKPKEAAQAAIAVGRRPRLIKLIIKNFRCIGASPVSIELDDIVVLVGPNNAGKSSVLKAYEVVMSDGSDAGRLKLEDFPNGKVTQGETPEIELHTIVFDNLPGSEWMETTSTNEVLVKERWTWSAPGAAQRRGYNVQLQRWATDDDKEKMPWGAPGVANAYRPQPHLVDAFASPDEQAGEIVKLLMTAIKDRVKAHQTNYKTDDESDFGKLLSGIGELQKKIVAESQQQISEIENNLSGYIGKVFPGHRVVLDAKPEDDLDKAINLFKANPQLLMGPEGGHLSTIGHQGSGARRTLLWTAIRLLAESGTKANAQQRPHVLLLDEPEICLHPVAIREACELLYGLPALTGSWQVMVTTHSPCFVDFSRDHTSIVRVARAADGHVTGTTIFRPERADFDDSDRENLKLLNICDPYIAEFFFGGRSVVVEGDTEHAAFKMVMARYPNRFAGVHIIRARGKATIVSLCKILNQFHAPYAILHDSDLPTYQKKDGSQAANPAWAHNSSILSEMKKSKEKTRIIASNQNFELAYLKQEVKADKPYTVATRLGQDEELLDSVALLLDALCDFDKDPPEGAIEWSSIDTLRDHILRPPHTQPA